MKRCKNFSLFLKVIFFGYRKTREFLAFLPKLDQKQTKKKNEYTIWLHEDLLWQLKQSAHYSTREIPNRLRPLDKEKIKAAEEQINDHNQKIVDTRASLIKLAELMLAEIAKVENKYKALDQNKDVKDALEKVESRLKIPKFTADKSLANSAKRLTNR